MASTRNSRWQLQNHTIYACASYASRQACGKFEMAKLEEMTPCCPPPIPFTGQCNVLLGSYFSSIFYLISAMLMLYLPFCSLNNWVGSEHLVKQTVSQKVTGIFEKALSGCCSLSLLVVCGSRIWLENLLTSTMPAQPLLKHLPLLFTMQICVMPLYYCVLRL